MTTERQPNSTGLAHRLVRGFGATALNPIVTAAIQLGTVPPLLHVWGAAKYGDWLLLSALPGYFTLTNLGFGDASGSDMTMRVAADDRQGALETFQSCWMLLTLVSLAVLAIASAVIWRASWQNWMRLSSISSTEAAYIILAFGTYIVISQQCGILESGFRCDGNFALGTVCGTLLRFFEAVLGTVVGIITSSLLLVALTYLAVRSIGTLAYALLLRRKSPWLRIGFRHARRQRIKELARPALGFMALPLGYAITLQGFTLMIGTLEGPVAVTAFSTLRTLTRMNFQLMTVIAWTLWLELSSAFGSGNISLARKLHRHAYQAGLFLSIDRNALLVSWAAHIPYLDSSRGRFQHYLFSHSCACHFCQFTLVHEFSSANVNQCPSSALTIFSDGICSIACSGLDSCAPYRHFRGRMRFAHFRCRDDCTRRAHLTSPTAGHGDGIPISAF